jgi:transposase
MFSLGSSHRFYLYRHPTDMRKSFDSLCGIIEEQLKGNPVNGEVYVFINRPRNRIKLLHWEHGGFVIYYKRLESGTLEIPEYDDKSNCFVMSWTELVMMVEGIRWQKLQRQKRYEPIAVDKKVEEKIVNI